MYSFGITSNEDHCIAEKILIKIGIHYQAHCDYLDLSDDPVNIGEKLSDMEEGKSALPKIITLQNGTEEQIGLIKMNFDKSVNGDKSIFNNMNLKEKFRKEEEQKRLEIMEFIEKIDCKSLLNPNIFIGLLNLITKKEKLNI